jgi:hypothetical protein
MAPTRSPISFTRVILKSYFQIESRKPLTRPPATLSPSDGERDGVRGRSENIPDNRSGIISTIMAREEPSSIQSPSPPSFNVGRWMFDVRCLLRTSFGLLVILHCSHLSAAEIPESQLPPPATNAISFTHDIKPILDRSCLRCHGADKPKSRFRLDSREAALKGGVIGINIIPGDSANSPLIHYVAHLVEDMEMPPVGSGEPLTDAEVGLLRAWIDQGLAWDAAPATNQFTFSATPAIGGVAVHGNERQFRAHHAQPDGLNGVLQELDYGERLNANTTLSLSGHAWRDDYRVRTAVERTELGFVHFGWEQYRKYYADTGGYFPALSPAAPQLDRDLYLDIGKAWIDFGLTLPDWPRLVLGYEYAYKRGEKSTLNWNATTPGATRNIGPASKQITEDAHIIKFSLDHEVYGITVEERFRGEFYELQTHRTNRNARLPVTESVSESYRHFQGVNTLRLEKWFASRWFGSAGYLYSKLNADATFQNDMTFNTLIFQPRVPQITLERESQLLNLNSLVGPWAGFTLSGGVQSEWTRQNGFGSGELNRFNFPAAPPGTLAVTNTTLISHHDEHSLTESLALRFNRIPFTTLFADARLQQRDIGQSDSDLQPSGDFMRDVDFSSRLTDLRGGFNTSPWRKISFSSHYRFYDHESRYRNQQPPQPVGGYPGFINAREVETDEIAAKLTLHPASWFKTTLSCLFSTSDYWTDTNPAFSTTPPGNVSPGGNILAGEQESHLYSLGLALTPWQRLHLTASFSYQDSTTTTAHNNSPAVAPYRGDVYSATLSGNYVLSESTDLFASHSFSAADYRQNNFASGLPVGIEYQQHTTQIGLARHLGQNATVRLQYGFYHYDEPSSGGINNYEAHAIYGMITVRLP